MAADPTVTPEGPGVCRTCRASVTWARHHETRKAMPLERNASGGFVLSLSAPIGSPVYGTPAKLRAAGHVAGILRYQSHYATCPDAEGWRTRGGAGAAVALLVGVVALALLAIAPRAGATPVPAPAGAQATSTRAVELLQETLRVPLAVPSLHSATAADLSTPEAMAEAAGDGIRALPWITRQAELIDRGKVGPWAPLAGHVLLHEAGHYVCDDCRRTLGEAWVDEGIVDAVAADLDPVWQARELGEVEGPWVAYTEAVAYVRAVSAKATGSRTWRTRAARLWRRTALIGPGDVRAAMIPTPEAHLTPDGRVELGP